MDPMLATPGPLPVGPEWLYEVKWDGMRLMVDVTDGVLTLTSRAGRDITANFPELAGLAKVAADVALDGEVVVLASGIPSFSALAERMHGPVTAAVAEQRPIALMVFDVLRLYGVSLLDRSLTERRATLERIDIAAVGSVELSPVYDDGPALLAATRERGLEGVLAKRRDSGYRPGRRSEAWVKVTHRQTQACLVGGWRAEPTDPARIGSLLLGVPDPGGRLRFTGRVGSGVGSDATQRALHTGLQPLHRPGTPFGDELPAADAGGARWCEPRLVVEVSHVGWTDAGLLRHPVLRGLRADLAPADVSRGS